MIKNIFIGLAFVLCASCASVAPPVTVLGLFYVAHCGEPRGAIVVASDGTFKAIELTPDSSSVIEAIQAKLPKDKVSGVNLTGIECGVDE